MKKDQRMTMKNLPLDDRPVEKILRQGVRHVSDAELLAVIIRSGSRQESALTLCQRLLRSDDGSSSLIRLRECSIEELTGQPGIGPVKAAQILAALELGIRMAGSREQPRRQIQKPDDALLLLDAEMRGLPREELRTVLLDVRNRVIRISRISEGGLTGAVIYPRDLFREAIRANAAAMILAHNHPSGDATPSQDDIETTRKLAEAGEMVGIRVIDHLILARGGSLSMKQEGYI